MLLFQGLGALLCFLAVRCGAFAPSSAGLPRGLPRQRSFDESRRRCSGSSRCGALSRAPRLRDQQQRQQQPRRVAPAALAPLDFAEWATAQRSSPLLFCAAHAGAIVVCFPLTIAFEVAEGFLFGPLFGLLLGWVAKTTAAAATYGVARAGAPALRASPIGARLIEAIQNEPRIANATRDATASDGGAAVTLVARLSPLPSYVNNYGLALLGGVRFRGYLAATAVASVPALATHVAFGATLGALDEATLLGGGGGAATTIMTTTTTSGAAASAADLAPLLSAALAVLAVVGLVQFALVTKQADDSQPP